MKMVGRQARVCDAKFCTCNPGNTKDRVALKRSQKRRERQQWKKEMMA